MTIRPALDGISGACFVYPILPGIADATAYFAQAAKEATVSTVVNTSQVSARREAKSHAAFNHWMAERVFDWSGLRISMSCLSFLMSIILFAQLEFSLLEY